MHCTIARFRLYPAAIIITSLIGSIASPVEAARPPPFSKEFLVTAYYSPLPDQCCYYRGSYEADIAFNGQGKMGADGTPVYGGMLAAPKEYEFGTRIAIDGIGIGTVHDRGGRIVDIGDVTRIDVWMGSGEEGLARALHWGARRMKGTVYPVDSAQPSESLSLDRLQAPTYALRLLAARRDSEPSILDLSYGDSSQSVRLLQQMLKDAGYFTERITPNFGEQTRAALAQLQADIGLPADGSEVDTFTSNALTSLASMKKQKGPSVALGLRRGSRGTSVSSLQRTLRYLGYYTGRTDGVFSPALANAVLTLQKEHQLIRSDTDTGAGRIGPQTKSTIVRLWKAKQATLAAAELALKQKLSQTIAESLIPEAHLSKGDHGDDVRTLQKALSTIGVFRTERINANFGDMTRSALLAYQLKQKIIASEEDLGAGTFGQMTKRELIHDLTTVAWNDVRAGNGEKWGL